ncbi:MAG: DUF2267 domain-containing protein [Reyranella sp.]|nr:DUF2267 domain-containing protein [Reyranella sp.]
MGRIDRTGPDRPVQINEAWIGELDQGLGWNDKPRSYRLLNAVLHAMRESLPADEMADPEPGFPVRLCGTCCDDWRLPTAVTVRGAALEFIGRVSLRFKPDPLEDPTAAIFAVFGMLARKMGERGIGVLARGVPAELQDALTEGWFSMTKQQSLPVGHFRPDRRTSDSSPTKAKRLPLAVCDSVSIATPRPSA